MNERVLESFVSEYEKIANLGQPSLLDSYDKKRDGDALTSLLKANRPGNIMGTIAGAALGAAVLPQIPAAIQGYGSVVENYMRGGFAEPVRGELIRRGIGRKGLKGATNPKGMSKADIASIYKRLKQESGKGPVVNWWKRFSGKDLLPVDRLQVLRERGLEQLKSQSRFKTDKGVELALQRKYLRRGLKGTTLGLLRPALAAGTVGAVGGFIYNRRQRKKRDALLDKHEQSLFRYEAERRRLEAL